MYLLVDGTTLRTKSTYTVRRRTT